MKAGIVTLQGYDNYGNRLQNLAVNKILETLGIEADTIVIRSREELLTYKGKRNIKNTVQYALKTRLPLRLTILIGTCKRMLGDTDNRKREYNFRMFNRNYLNIKTFYCRNCKELQRNAKLQKYDYFFVGSDQVWNPDAGRVEDQYFLMFAPPEKRIGFIASIGADSIPTAQRKHFKESLSKMKYLSVREEKAAELIEELTGLKADLFFDPVLLIDKRYWMHMAAPVLYKLPKEYILSFFLGEEPNEEIKEFARKKKCAVIHMNQRQYKEFYSLGPSQFLYMILHAQYILTDSFHVTAFSVIFQRQFFVFRRAQKNMENMFSRLETLLGRLGLSERIWLGEETARQPDLSDEFYMKIDKILERDRKRLDKKIREICFGSEKNNGY